MALQTPELTNLPDEHGHFGPYGGSFVPETLITALRELETAYAAARKDCLFRDELASLLQEFAGRPTPLYFAERLTKQLGGAKVYLKREDLLHTGAHKINNAIGQVCTLRANVRAANERTGGGGMRGRHANSLTALRHFTADWRQG